MIPHTGLLRAAAAGAGEEQRLCFPTRRAGLEETFGAGISILRAGCLENSTALLNPGGPGKGRADSSCSVRDPASSHWRRSICADPLVSAYLFHLQKSES